MSVVCFCKIIFIRDKVMGELIDYVEQVRRNRTQNMSVRIYLRMTLVAVGTRIGVSDIDYVEM